VTVAVRVTPKAGRNAIGGRRELSDGREALDVRVREAASEGEANEAVLRLVAASLGLPKRAVSLASGQTSRLKLLRIEGNADMIVPALARLAATG
jgi:hypothetical protein